MVSETSSYWNREAELRTIEKRFADVLAKKKPKPSISSRFKEDFETGSNSSVDQGPSILSKLHLSIPKRLKGDSRSSGDSERVRMDPTGNLPCKKSSNWSIRGHLQPLSSVDYEKHMGRLTPVSAESASSLWQRAIRQEAERRELHKNDGNGVMSRGMDQQNPTRSAGSLCDDNVFLQHGEENSPAKRLSQLHQPPQSAWIVQRWASELDTQHEGRVPENNINRGHSVRSAMPPKSWSKWPSHSRSSRTGAASLADNVKPKDFAVKEVAPGGIVSWSTDKPVSSEHPRLTARTLSGKFGKAVKSQFGKLARTTSGLTDGFQHSSLDGRRGSSQTAKNLEYPELEILPTEGGFKELQALEQEIDLVKGIGQQQGHGMRVNTASSRSLSATLPIMLREAGEENCSLQVPSDAKARGQQDSNDRPNTPAGLISVSALGSSNTPDIFVTPASRQYSGFDASPLADSDVISVKSDSALVIRQPKSVMQKRNPASKFSTWNGRSMTQPLMLRSTQDFALELNKRLEMERERVLAAC